MNEKAFSLSQTDINAVLHNDSNYLNSKGAELYRRNAFSDAVEYYRLAAAMGNVDSISNLGYCHLYGRDTEANLSLALAYFEIAAARHNIDAMYKLGDIFGSDKWGIKDEELSVYYYRMAASELIGTEWENSCVIVWSTALQKYPSLCYALGRELSRGGTLYTDISSAYQFLKHAEKGYKAEIANGSAMYESAYAGVAALLADPQFDDVRSELDALFETDCDDSPDEC